MNALAAFLGRLIGEAIRPILMEVIREALSETGEVAKPNPELEEAWGANSDDDLFSHAERVYRETEGDFSSTGNDSSNDAVGQGSESPGPKQ